MIVLRLAQLLAFALLMFALFLLTRPAGLQWWGEDFPVLAYILVCIAAILGVFFGCLFRRLAPRKHSVNILRESKMVLRSVSFWRALCASPLVFGSIFVYVNQRPGDLPSLLLAFQNGFFCESILSRLSPNDGGTEVQVPLVDVKKAGISQTTS